MKNAQLLHIEKATTDDLYEIQELFVNTIQTICSKDYDARQIEAWTSSVANKERWKNKLNNQYYIVARMNDQIVGFASLEKDYLDFMYVHADFQQMGIADKLLKELESEAIRNGVTEISSAVSKTARPFFEKMNFEWVADNNHIINGVEIQNYKMRKFLKHPK